MLGTTTLAIYGLIAVLLGPFALLVAPSTMLGRQIASFGRTRLILPRSYSTGRPLFRGNVGSHIAAGVCGGLAVIAGGKFSRTMALWRHA